MQAGLARAPMERGVFIDGEGRPPPEEALASSSDGGVWLLCYFSYKHNDFRIAEAQALAELAGCGDSIRWCAHSLAAARRRCRELDLPSLAGSVLCVRTAARSTTASKSLF